MGLATFVFACVGDSTVGPGPDAGSDTSFTDATNDVVVADVVSEEASTFTPASVSGLVLWLDDTSVQTTGGVLTAWNDKSPQANNAMPSSPAPAVKTGASGLDGKTIVRFDGSSTFLTINDASSLHWTASGFLLELVIRQSTSDMTSQTLWFKEDTTNHGMFLECNPDSSSVGEGEAVIGFASSETITSAASAAFGLPLRVRARWDTVTLDFALPGAEKSSAASSTNMDASGAAVLIGKTDQSIAYFAGDMAEVIAVSPPPDAATQQAIEDYLDSKYGL